jgi:glucan 1,3-beta-glucosidase
MINMILGHPKGDNQFKQHRDNFITEQDFREIAAAKMNTVRIPIGYWITGFDNQPGGDPNGWKVYAPGGINYLDRAIREWAPRHGLVVLISLHAAKGSQNGNDHSSPSDPGNSHWSQYPENVRNTLDAVEWLARRYNNDVSFLGIGLLNEPMSKSQSLSSSMFNRTCDVLVFRNDQRSYFETVLLRCLRSYS